MYKLGLGTVELAVDCLTDLCYDEVRYMLDMTEEEVEVVIASCKKRFDEMRINAYVDYRYGYFKRVNF